MFYEKKHEQPWKVLIPEKKSEAPWCVFLEQKTEAAWLLCCVCVPVQKKNCSSGLEEKLQQQVFVQHKKKILIYTAGSGEIFINLFLI